MTATLTYDAPVRGVTDGKGHPDPAVRRAWLDQRRGGITATEIRDWGQPSKRRAIVTAKVTGEDDDQWGIPVPGQPYTLGQYADHGNAREPMIADWVRVEFGIEPCSHVYSHALNPRHLASPDGISLVPYSGGQLEVGTEDAVLAEIKTSKNDLTPGSIDAARVLVSIEPGSKFDKSGYYVQMNWQMYVMNATRTLFVWETHDNVLDPETGTFTPLGPPEWCWVPRDQALIDVLVDEVAPRALAEIDAARLAHSLGDLPPVSDLPVEDAVLVAEYFQALDNEKVAAAAKAQAWTALQERYASQDSPDTSIDAGFARITVSTVRSVKRVVDENGMREQARTTVERYEKLRERFTSQEPVEAKKLTITRPK
jgi:hypothetical protein